ncbi:MAG TPA: alpha/beta hydrolase [Bdellovibrionales bacterium]|nr:alpha/beta hydrolase [Bdellovibrionales bacterium]
MKRTEGYFRGHKDFELFYQSWLPSKPVGTLVVTHGLGEHSECYDRLAKGLSESQWGIYAWDLRGHGRSEGNRGVIESFADYTNDLAHFITHLKTLPVKPPIILLGHSMGGLVNLRALLQHGTLDVSALALSSPLMGLTLRVPELKKKAAQVLAKYMPTFTLYNEVAFNDLTRDRDVIAEYERDQLRHDRSSALLYLQVLENTEFVLKNAHTIHLPALLQQAGEDRVVDREASRKLFDNLGSKDKEWLLYEGFKHEIFNETQRNRVYQDLRKWLARWK